jgi:hypothetical protein
LSKHNRSAVVNSTERHQRPYTNRIVEPEDFEYSETAASLGIAFDAEGMHLCEAWSDGDVSYYLKPWSEVSASVMLSPESLRLIANVDEVFVNSRTPKLTNDQTKRMHSIVETLFSCPRGRRVSDGCQSKQPTTVGNSYGRSLGKALSMEAAAYGFGRRVKYLQQKHRKSLRKVAARRDKFVNSAD